MGRFDLGVHGGTVVGARGRARSNLHVRDGRIAHVGPERLDAEREVDATGLYVLPGMVDTHVHLMDPGQTDRETFPDGTAAAAASGVTTIIEHSHHRPVRSVQDLKEKVTYLDGRSRVDFGLAAHVWPATIPSLRELWEEGVAFFKIFTCTTHGVPGLPPAQLWDALTQLAAFDGICLVHCEEESMTADAERRLRDAGREDGAVLVEWRSREAELVAVAVTALLTGAAGAGATIAHVSSPEAAAVVDDARRAGARLAAETCPQYLLLREWEVLEHGTLRKFTPPARARSEADEEEMWRLLREGTLTHVSSDHAPSTLAQKGEGGIWEAHFGLPGLDTTMRVLLDAAFRGRIALEDVVRLYSTTPATLYGLFPRKGQLVPGSDADLVLVEGEGESVIRNEDCLSKAGWSPFAGRAVRGKVVATFLRGRVISEERRPTEELTGRFVPGPGYREDRRR